MAAAKTGKFLILIATALWAAALSAGFIALSVQNAEPGVAGTPPEHWPGSAPFPLDTKRTNVLLFIDARCPCARASLSEFGRIIAESNGKADFRVVFIPSDEPDDEDGAALLEQLSRTAPGAILFRDPRFAAVKTFGIATSGHVLLYDPGGVLRYSGGITPARGHEGDNYGRDAVIAAIRDPTATGCIAKPVFGCPIATNDTSLAGEVNR